ncbi:MAG: site-specific integrase [Planctomycetaceae bacterium]|nr:site-specific integrase [Planctomycetaceae bacterium]
MSATKRPSYLLHRPTGQARVRIRGRDHYLGKYGSAESKQRYEQIVGDWLAGQDPKRSLLTVDDLALAFCDWGKEYYRRSDGTPSGELRNIREALEPLAKLWGNTLIRDFGPLRLKEVREEMISRGWCRSHVNRNVGRIKRVFGWGTENEIVPPVVNQGIRAVAALRSGRTKARETEPIGPIDEAIVLATLPHLTSVLSAMVRLQLLCGMRPGEVCAIRPCDITMRTDGVWTFRPPQHKTAHCGKNRVIFVGPEGQDVLRPFLQRASESRCFVPAESEAERKVKLRLNRVTPMTPSQANRIRIEREYTDAYRTESYGKAIRRACAHRMPPHLKAPRERKESKAEKEIRLQQRMEWEKANVWSPNRLRHLRGTMVRERFGLEVASCVLGHSGLKVTEVYAQKNEKAAAEAMRLIG